MLATMKVIESRIEHFRCIVPGNELFSLTYYWLTKYPISPKKNKQMYSSSPLVLVL